MAANLGYRPRYKEGYFPVPPMTAADLRAKCPRNAEGRYQDRGPPHEWYRRATEITCRFGTLSRWRIRCSSTVIVKNVCSCPVPATFMPKPLFGDNGSGMQPKSL